MTEDPRQVLIDQGIAELKLTTVGYVNAYWRTPPSGSRWEKALAYLAQAHAITCPSNSLYPSNTAP